MSDIKEYECIVVDKYGNKKIAEYETLYLTDIDGNTKIVSRAIINLRDFKESEYKVNE